MDQQVRIGSGSLWLLSLALASVSTALLVVVLGPEDGFFAAVSVCVQVLVISGLATLDGRRAAVASVQRLLMRAKVAVGICVAAGLLPVAAQALGIDEAGITAGWLLVLAYTLIGPLALIAVPAFLAAILYFVVVVPVVKT